MVGLAFLFAAEAVGALWEGRLVGQPEITARGAAAVAFGDVLAQAQCSFLAAVTDGVSHDLAGASAERQPQPALLVFFATKLQSSSSSSTSPAWLGKSVSSKAGSAATFFPHPCHHGLVANPEGARDAADAHAILVGGHHLVLELLVVARPLGRECERALAVHAFGSLRPVLRVPVLLQTLVPTMRTPMNRRR